MEDKERSVTPSGSVDVELLDDEEEVCRLEDKDLVDIIRTSINGELINSESFGSIFIQYLYLHKIAF